eukprot:673610-Prorocentrum_minimum.AAC.1
MKEVVLPYLNNLYARAISWQGPEKDPAVRHSRHTDRRLALLQLENRMVPSVHPYRLLFSTKVKS